MQKVSSVLSFVVNEGRVCALKPSEWSICSRASRSAVSQRCFSPASGEASTTQRGKTSPSVHRGRL